MVQGLSLHVGKATSPGDRAGLERMIRYEAGPAFSHKRLSITANGKVSYRLERPWYTGQTHVTREPVASLRRLATVIAPPGVHLTRFRGAFAPRSKLRSAVVSLVPGSAAATGAELLCEPGTTGGTTEGTDDGDHDKPANRSRRWSHALGRPRRHHRGEWLILYEVVGIVNAIPGTGHETGISTVRAILDLMPAAKKHELATFADLASLGDEAHAEIIAGEIVDKASPTMEHGRAQKALGGYVHRRFDRKPGGRWPGGWWIGTEVDVEYEAHELYRHDIVGWRRERVPDCPTGRPVRVRPDWVCEILSPSNEKRDLVDKMRTLHGASVPHYWILNPEEKVLVVHRHSTDGYIVVLTATSGDTVHAEPFEDTELRVGVLCGDEDEDE